MFVKRMAINGIGFRSLNEVRSGKAANRQETQDAAQRDVRHRFYQSHFQ
jgi:hypothetical protein